MFDTFGIHYVFHMHMFYAQIVPRFSIDENAAFFFHVCYLQSQKSVLKVHEEY